ncbi:hypothetical protein IFO69_10670 [Echinicola sp. CAU 1574]|uniref:Bacterial repeat domain-containing protein n=1 Tax=Echinicola arenosa TaxID=2774144 RepID=A0ABR9AK70_9BACT|nr:hypothetical protein [Echinicola arenosa]MBD8489208.1 hypothetical protein [Echinicola arenosa]
METSYRIFLLLILFTLGSCKNEDEEPQESYTLSVMASPKEAGEVNVSPDRLSYVEGQSVSLSAVPNENWIFEKWEGDVDDSSSPLSIIMNSDKNITAVFIKKDYPLTINIVGEGTVNEVIVHNPGGRGYPHGTTVELTPEPSEGWEFDSWDGDLSGNEVPQQITVDGEKNVTVRFKEVNFMPAIPAKNIFGQPYVVPSCRLIEAYNEGSDSKTVFEYYDNGMIKRWIEIDGGVGVDTLTVEYRADGLIHIIQEYFNTMTMGYNSEGRLERVFLEHNASGYKDTTDITYVGDRTVRIVQKQFGYFIGNYVHEFDDNYNLIRSVLNDPSNGQTAYERISAFYTDIQNIWLSFGDLRFHFLLAGDYFGEGTYPVVASANLIKSTIYINHYENLPEREYAVFDVLSVNDHGFPTKILNVYSEEEEEVTILKYECDQGN